MWPFCCSCVGECVELKSWKIQVPAIKHFRHPFFFHFWHRTALFVAADWGNIHRYIRNCGALVTSMWNRIWGQIEVYHSFGSGKATLVKTHQ